MVVAVAAAVSAVVEQVQSISQLVVGVDDCSSDETKWKQNCRLVQWTP